MDTRDATQRLSLLVTTARVCTLALVMLAVAWLLLGATNVTDRQRLTFGAALVGLAWLSDAAIRTATSPPPQFDEDDD